MQHIASVVSSREAGRLLGIDATTVQRAIGRGELNASRPREHAPYRIRREDLLKWGADNGLSLVNGSERVDLATGEVLEPDASTPEPKADKSAAVADARARLAGVAIAKQEAATDAFVAESRERLADVNVSRVLLPSAETGLLEAARRLVQLPESPELWQALRAVLGVAL